MGLLMGWRWSVILTSGPYAARQQQQEAGVVLLADRERQQQHQEAGVVFLAATVRQQQPQWLCQVHTDAQVCVSPRAACGGHVYQQQSCKWGVMIVDAY